MVNPNFILDGRKLAHQRSLDLLPLIQSLKSQEVYPSLSVILVGDNPASHVYVRNKVKACESMGIGVVVHAFPSTVSYTEVIYKINILNQDSSVHGILVQLPLPWPDQTRSVLDSISPSKDVDGLHPLNLGLLAQNRPSFIPCTPLGCLHLIQAFYPDLKGKKICVLGRSRLVGKPLSLLLSNYDATVTLIHSRSLHIQEMTIQADILVVAIGQSYHIDASFVKEGSLVLDVGIHEWTDPVSRQKKLTGDVNYESVKQKTDWVTPVPGGVGPMTIMCLMENVIQSAFIQTLGKGSHHSWSLFKRSFV
jgi:methylenetetrahydrofolate dehydrogenase (NADP+)/methenyltetrahydrofolate cyclohydrolase